MWPGMNGMASRAASQQEIINGGILIAAVAPMHAVLQIIPDSTSRDGIKGSKTSLHLSERKARGNITTKSPTCGSNNVTNDGKHGNSTVLGLYVSQSFESFLISIVKKSKRIPESERRLGTKGICNITLKVIN